MAREYVVLARNGTGWKEPQTVEAITPEHAIEKVADTEGAYVAIPAQHWTVRTVAPVTKLGVVAEEAAA